MKKIITYVIAGCLAISGGDLFGQTTTGEGFESAGVACFVWGVHIGLDCASAANQTFKIDVVTGYAGLICTVLFYIDRHAYRLARCK